MYLSQDVPNESIWVSHLVPGIWVDVFVTTFFEETPLVDLCARRSKCRNLVARFHQHQLAVSHSDV